MIIRVVDTPCSKPNGFTMFHTQEIGISHDLNSLKICFSTRNQIGLDTSRWRFDLNR
jgi:hypothetical protein